MSVAAALTATRGHPSPYFSNFDPDALDPITLALVSAETVTDVVAVRRQNGPDADRTLQAAIDADPVKAMAQVMVARHRKGYATTENALLALGFSRAAITKHGPEAQKQAYAMMAQTPGGGDDDDDQAERLAMLEASMCVHAGGEA